jgi:hypothetical protein
MARLSKTGSLVLIGVVGGVIILLFLFVIGRATGKPITRGVAV